MSNTINATSNAGSSSECVKVMVRCRPINERERQTGQRVCVNIDSDSSNLTVSKPIDSTIATTMTANMTMNNDAPKMYTYDKVFDIDASQQSIYEESAFSLVESVSEGYNGTIFAYGQTGCGKTFTMMGDPEKEEMKGIIPRTFIHIMQLVETDPTKEFLVRCSYIEIYNEQIHDLLSSDPKARYELKESPDTGVFVKDLNKQVVKCVEDMNLFMNLGNKNRSIGSTAMNKESSRSHSIFTIFLEMSEEKVPGETRIRAGKLNLVDLAGSERQVKTQATGERLKEANQINLSLSALGNVISALVDGRHTHIPYRDSKLTRLLQDSLGGNTKTIMIATVSPTEINYEETIGTLRYAQRAKSIKNKPKINEDPKDALLREYQEEINRLKHLLQGGGGGAPTNQNSHGNTGSPGQVGVARPLMFETSLLSETEMERWKESHSALYKDRERMEAELNERREQIAKEREQRMQLEQRIKELQKDTLCGGKSYVQQDLSQNELRNSFDEVRKKLQKQEADHAAAVANETRKLEGKASKVNAKKYANLQEEVEAQRAEIKQLRQEIKGAEDEIVEIENEHRQDKEVLLASIRIFQRENKIAAAILEMAFKNNELNLIKNKAVWSDAKNSYSVPHFHFKSKEAVTAAAATTTSTVQRQAKVNYSQEHTETSKWQSNTLNKQSLITPSATSTAGVTTAASATAIQYEDSPMINAHNQRRTLAQLQQQQQELSRIRSLSQQKQSIFSKDSPSPAPTIQSSQQQQQQPIVYNNPVNNISVNLRPSRMNPYDFPSKSKEEIQSKLKRNLNGITLNPLNTTSNSQSQNNNFSTPYQSTTSSMNFTNSHEMASRTRPKSPATAAGGLSTLSMPKKSIRPPSIDYSNSENVDPRQITAEKLSSLKLAGLRVLCGETITNCLPLHMIFSNNGQNMDEDGDTQERQEKVHEDMLKQSPSNYNNNNTMMTASTGSNTNSSRSSKVSAEELIDEEESKLGGWGEPAELSNWETTAAQSTQTVVKENSTSQPFVDPFAGQFMQAAQPVDVKPKKVQQQKLGMMDEDRIQKKVEEKAEEKDEVDYFSEMNMGMQNTGLLGKKQPVQLSSKPVVVAPAPTTTEALNLFNKPEQTTQEELEAANNWGDDDIDL